MHKEKICLPEHLPTIWLSEDSIGILLICNLSTVFTDIIQRLIVHPNPFIVV